MIIRGDLLRHQREAMGLSQRALAEGICHQSLVSRMESEGHVTSMVILTDICHRLQIDLDKIVSLEEPNYLNLSAVRQAINNGDYDIARRLLKIECNLKYLPDEARPLYHTLHARLELGQQNFFGALNDLQNASVAVSQTQKNLLLEIEMVTTEVWIKLEDFEKARFCNRIAVKKVRNFLNSRNRQNNLNNDLIVSIYRQSADLALAQEAISTAEDFLIQAKSFVSKSTLTNELIRINLVEGKLRSIKKERKESCRAYLRAYTTAEQLGDTVMMEDIKPYLVENNIDYFD